MNAQSDSGRAQPPTSSEAATVDAAFDRALDLEDDAREAFLDSLDPGPRRLVRELLDAALKGGPLDRELGEVAGHLLETACAANELILHHRIGAWRLLERLGAGGMGVVYRVERAAGDFAQQAALKVIRWELADPSLERRFRSERRILAQLSHPNIASLIDGGVTESGLPYLVLEYVEGEPIDAYAERRGLDQAETLALVRTLAEAVDFAHRQLVVHRDLKPANVFIRADGVLKLLDFGVAKLMNDAGDATRLAPMTPRYAAPEQRQGAPASLASDVWSIGAVMTQLLTGRPPEEAPDGTIRLVGSHGDVGNILRRALDPDPTQRYRSAAELAEDLGRWQEGRPVRATPPTYRYRLRRWLGRHRAAAVVAAIAALIGIAGVAGIAWQAEEARQERDRARQEAERAEQVTQFLFDLFDSATPSLDAEPRVRDVLDRGVERLRAGGVLAPRSRSDLLFGLGDAYKWLREYERAEALLREVMEIEHTADPNGLRYATAVSALGGIYMLSGDPARGETHFRRALDLLDNVNDADASKASTLNSLGMARRSLGAPEEAIEHLEGSLEMFVQLEDVAGQAMAHGNLGLTHANLGQLALAESHHRAAARLYRESEPGNSTLSVVLTNLANTVSAQGRLDEAQEILEQVLGMQRAGTDLVPEIAVTEANLARLLIREGRAAEAAALAERAAANLERFEPGSMNGIANRANLGWAWALVGDFPRALDTLEHVVQALAERFGDDHRHVARGRTRYGAALMRAGRLPEARSQLDRAMRTYEAAGTTGAVLVDALMPLGALLCDQGMARKGLDILERAGEAFLEITADGDWRLALLAIERGRCLAALDERWDRDDIERAAEDVTRLRGADSWAVSRAATLMQPTRTP